MKINHQIAKKIKKERKWIMNGRLKLKQTNKQKTVSKVFIFP